MRFLEELAESPLLISRINPNSTSSEYVWVDKCHGFLHNTVLVAVSLFFVAYLAYEAKKSFPKLSNRRSYIMIAYYCCLWLVSLVLPPEKKFVWNVLTLLTTSGMLFLEVSLVAFLFQGNYASGAVALTRTFLISGFIIALDLLLKAIFLFGFGVPLFIDNNENGQKLKWGLWVIHKLLLTGVYGTIVLMYNSSWRERLPARPAFYKYITIMFALYGLCLVASVFTAIGVVWNHECLLSRILPSSSLHYFSRRLFPGRRFELGECIVLRDEGCWIFQF